MSSSLTRWLDHSLPRGRFIVGLDRATLGYLGLPVLLWTWGWLHWAWAAVVTACMLAAGVAAFRQAGLADYGNRNRSSRDLGLPMWALVVVALIGCLFSLYSGAGGFTFQNPDWDKHSAILKDLIEAPWPVTYRIGDNDTPLVYYLAYYLPAGLVGKFAGWWWASFALLVWTTLGVCLALYWFVLLAQHRPVVSALFFVFANGLDFVGQRLVSGEPMMPGVEHIDWWSGWVFLNFPGHLSQLNWAPQHSLAAWLIIGSVAMQLPRRHSVCHLGILAAFAAYWSPFTVMGLAPFYLLALIRQQGRGVFHWMNLAAIPVLLVGVLYFSSTTLSPPKGWWWEAHAVREEIGRFIFFHLLEWGVFYLFARELRRSEDPWLRWLFWCLPAVLISISLYHFGVFNDSCMRVPIPALFLLWAGVARSLVQPPFNLESRILVLLCLLGALGALPETVRSWHPPTLNIVEAEERVHIPNLEEGINDQYLGSKEAFFFRYLARGAEALPVTMTPANP